MAKKIIPNNKISELNEKATCSILEQVADRELKEKSNV